MNRAFPVVPPPDSDPRFTFGLVLDVAKVLAEHGYPEVTDLAVSTGGLDFIALQQALYCFIYISPEEMP